MSPHRACALSVSGLGSGPARHLLASPAGPIQRSCGPLDIWVVSIHIFWVVVVSAGPFAYMARVREVAFAGAMVCRVAVEKRFESEEKSASCSLIVFPWELV